MRGRERKILERMLVLYCWDHHAPADRGSCPACLSLRAYALGRLDRCPFAEKKPACSACRVPCYRPAEREKIRAVMRYAGPRMLWRHPWLALCHLREERRGKRTGLMPPSR